MRSALVVWLTVAWCHALSSFPSQETTSSYVKELLLRSGLAPLAHAGQHMDTTDLDTPWPVFLETMEAAQVKLQPSPRNETQGRLMEQYRKVLMTLESALSHKNSQTLPGGTPQPGNTVQQQKQDSSPLAMLQSMRPGRPLGPARPASPAEPARLDILGKIGSFFEKLMKQVFKGVPTLFDAFMNGNPARGNPCLDPLRFYNYGTRFGLRMFPQMFGKFKNMLAALESQSQMTKDQLIARLVELDNEKPLGQRNSKLKEQLERKTYTSLSKLVTDQKAEDQCILPMAGVKAVQGLQEEGGTMGALWGGIIGGPAYEDPFGRSWGDNADLPESKFCYTLLETYLRMCTAPERMFFLQMDAQARPMDPEERAAATAPSRPQTPQAPGASSTQPQPPTTEQPLKPAGPTKARDSPEPGTPTLPGPDNLAPEPPMAAGGVRDDLGDAGKRKRSLSMWSLREGKGMFMRLHKIHAKAGAAGPGAKDDGREEEALDHQAFLETEIALSQFDQQLKTALTNGHAQKPLASMLDSLTRASNKVDKMSYNVNDAMFDIKTRPSPAVQQARGWESRSALSTASTRSSMRHGDGWRSKGKALLEAFQQRGGSVGTGQNETFGNLVRNSVAGVGSRPAAPMRPFIMQIFSGIFSAIMAIVMPILMMVLGILIQIFLPIIQDVLLAGYGPLLMFLMPLFLFRFLPLLLDGTIYAQRPAGFTGPDPYDAYGPDSPEPRPFKKPVMQMCYRLLDTWTYKCNVPHEY